MSEKKKKNSDAEKAAKTPESDTPETVTPAEDTAPQSDKAPETPDVPEETFTVTKEQMEKMEGLARLVSDTNEKYLRLAAEYDNFRKRTAKEKESLYNDARMDTIKAFLSVYDNLERGAQQFAEGDPHRQGLEMILKQFMETLTKMGVTVIEAEGQTFDPGRHNAVMHVEDEDLGENVVAEVFQKGFMLGDKVLRFAMVKVAN